MCTPAANCSAGRFSILCQGEKLFKGNAIQKCSIYLTVLEIEKDLTIILNFVIVN